MAQAERAERRLRERRNKPFEEVVREKLDEAMTPGTEIHQFVSKCIWDGMPLELGQRILQERAVAEAERELGQRSGVAGEGETEAEREAYLIFLQEN